jgi:hypothetical protein
MQLWHTEATFLLQYARAAVLTVRTSFQGQTLQAHFSNQREQRRDGDFEQGREYLADSRDVLVIFAIDTPTGEKQGMIRRNKHKRKRHGK